jgi:hypothetical protein
MLSSLTPSRLIALLKIIFWAALIFAITMALVPKPPPVLGEMKDKYQHIVAFAVLALLASAAYPRASVLRIAERLSFVGALIEVLQSIPALHRDCQIMDWVADTGAILVVLGIITLARRRGLNL